MIIDQFFYIICLSSNMRYLLFGIAANLATVLVTLLSMDTKSWLLLKHFLASINATNIRIMLYMGIYVFHKILALRECSITNLTFESLNRFVNVDKVAFKAVKRWESAITVIMKAFDTLLFWILTLNHCLEFILNLPFGFSCQLESNGKTLDIIFIYVLTAILVLWNVVLITVTKFLTLAFNIYIICLFIFYLLIWCKLGNIIRRNSLAFEWALNWFTDIVATLLDGNVSGPTLLWAIISLVAWLYSQIWIDFWHIFWSTSLNQSCYFGFIDAIEIMVCMFTILSSRILSLFTKNLLFFA